MPVIDGVKVACPPCIRGHRSTKCTHQSERIMVAVRKPGRPLSSCPHQKGKPCTCNNITAAIPRNAQCACGTPSPNSAVAKAAVKTEPNSAPDMTPMSPMSPTKMTSFRVQKSTAGKPPSRKQTHDISLLSQMDPDSINVIPSQGLALGINDDMHHAGSISSPPFMSDVQPGFNSGGPLPQFEYTKLVGSANGTALDVFFNGTHGPLSDLPPGGISSSETLVHPSLGAMSPPQYTPTAGPLPPGSRTNGSCCSKKATILKPAHDQLEQRNQPEDVLGLMGYGSSLPTYNTSVTALEFNTMNNASAMHHHTQQTTSYTFPVQYGSSFYEPLQFSQWQEMMASQPQGIVPHNGYMASHSVIEANPGVASAYASNQCFCGEGCQCLGCATHPFNSAMQEYVLSAMQDDHSLSPKSDGDSNGVPGATNETPSAILTSPGTADASPIPDVGSAGINDYLFVAYCPGNSQTCPCGDDCACVGCMIHCDTAPKTPITPP